MSPTTYKKQGVESVGGGHVAICAWPFTSHPQALVNLAVKLANAAPETAFSFLTTQTSKHSLLLAADSSGAPLPTNLVLYAVPDGLPEDDGVSADDDQRNHYHMDCFNMAMPGNFKQGIDAAVKACNKKISYIIADAFCGRVVAIIAKEMELPWAALWVLAPFALDPFFQMEHIYQLYLKAQAQADGDGDGDIIIPGLSPLRFTDLPGHSLQPSGEGWAFFLPIMRALPEASVVLMNACREICQYTPLSSSTSLFLDGEGPKLIRKLLFVGCLTLPAPAVIMSPPLGVAGEEEVEDDDDDDDMIFPWLSRQRAGSVAYVSLGTISALGDEELRGLAEALEARGSPFLWSLKESMMERLPRGFVERTREYGKVVPWVKQQAEVLRHGAIGVQVTHSGYNSVLESIFGGVPLICRSVWADNHMVRRWVEEVWGIGVGVEGGVFTKDGVLACLAAVFGEEEKGREMRANVAALRDKMLAAHGPNGSAAKDLEALLEMIHDAHHAAYT